MCCTGCKNLETESLEDIWEEGRPCEECLDEALPAWLLLTSVDNPDEGLPMDCDKCLNLPPCCFSADFELREGWGDPPLLQDLVFKVNLKILGREQL